MRLIKTAVYTALALPLFALGAQPGNPSSRVARISALTGAVSFQPAGAADWSNATLNYTVTTGDRIYTDQGARVELEVGQLSVRVSELSDITVTNLADHFMQIGAAQGVFRLTVYRMLPGDSVEVDTPNGAAVVTTVGEYRFDISTTDGITVISADAGSLEVIGPGVDQAVRGGQAVRLSGTDPIEIVSVARPGQTSFDTWGVERDRRVTSAPCSRHMSGDIPGCADLDDAGRWETSSDYGDVWYPSHVDAAWVPYRDGHWAWVEPWGWSWIDDESWGYAPFHYGRWARIGPAWGWVPGPREERPYYAPALVAFVGGAGWKIGVSIGAQAWFPLGPREAYFPSYHHDETYLRQVNVTNIHVTNINTVINVTNIEHVQYVNRTVGVTAVSTEAFRGGRPIAREVVVVKPEELARASVLAHPIAAPVERAALGGAPAARPPVAVRPVVVTTAMPRREPPARGAAVPPKRGEIQNPPPTRVKETPPPAASPPPVARGGGGRIAPPDPSRGGRPLIAKTPPPPVPPPFKAREPALQAHPGKPLEPQQVQKVRAGKPAGKPVDKEIPPHPVLPPAKPPVVAKTPPPAKGPPAKAPPRGGKRDSSGRGGRGME